MNAGEKRMNGPATSTRNGSRLDNLPVSTKIVLAVVVVAVVAMVTAGVAWARLGSLDVRVQQLKSSNITRLDALVNLQNGMADMYRALFLYQGAQTAADKAADKKLSKAGQDAVDTAGNQYVSAPDPSATWQSQTKAFGGAWTQYKALVNLLLFRDASPAGVTLPTALADQYALWSNSENTMNTAVDKLMDLERSQAAQNSAWPIDRPPTPAG